MIRTRQTIILLAALLASCATPQHRDTVTISIVGINDIHGQLGAADGHGGLVGISAYVSALRLAREAGGGAVVVVDAGDMWQGTLESNLSEGAQVIAAYNALGVAGAAIGNHEFDFGPVGPKAIPETDADDPRGALKQRALEARFPLLAANLVDDGTGLPVAWPNVQPSVIVEVPGVKIGVIGVITEYGLVTTIAANTTGLRVAPLAESVTREAHRLRADGAAIVIVVAHAGGRCDIAQDNASCDAGSELVQLAHQLDPGLVDHIFGGHLNNEIAHVVNGISVSVNLSKARSFGRVDFRVDRGTGAIVSRELLPLHHTGQPLPASYEGQPLSPVEGVARAAAIAAEIAAETKNRPLGVVLEEAFPLTGDMESALFNLATESLLASFDADVAILNVRGGLRSGLPAGELTYGDVYEMFPFDNVATLHEMAGRDLRRIIARQSQRERRTGFAGMRVFATCGNGSVAVRMIGADGDEIRDDDRIVVLANDFLALGGDDILTPVIPAGGFRLRFDQPRVRDVIVDWLSEHGGTISPDEWRSHDAPKWNPPGAIPADCAL